MGQTIVTFGKKQLFTKSNPFDKINKYLLSDILDHLSFSDIMSLSNTCKITKIKILMIMEATRIEFEEVQAL